MDLVFDTNILLAYVRNTAYILDPIEDELILSGTETQALIISAVSRGELLALGLYRGWISETMEKAQLVMGRFLQVGLDTADMFEAYAKADAFSRPLGRKMGKNDLWIAATAMVTNSVLVTTDDDFDHLAGLGLSLKNYSYILKQRESRDSK